MKPALCTVLLLVIGMVKCIPLEYYNVASTLENIDTEKLLSDKVKLKQYSDCFLDRGECNEIGKKVKEIIPDAIETACIKCSPKQKHVTRRYFEEMIREYPQDLGAFQTKYDSDFKQFVKFIEAIKDA